jgi:hypothetical protein
MALRTAGGAGTGTLTDDQRNILQELLSRTTLGAPTYGGVEATRLPVGDPRMLMGPGEWARAGALARGGLGDIASEQAGGGIVGQLLARSGSDVAPTAARTGGTLAPMTTAQVRSPAAPPIQATPPIQAMGADIIQRAIMRQQERERDREARENGKTRDVRIGIAEPPMGGRPVL